MSIKVIHWIGAVSFSIALLASALTTSVSAQFCSSWPCSSCNGYSCVGACQCQSWFAGVSFCWDCSSLYATNTQCEIRDGTDGTGFCPYTCGTGYDRFCFP